MSMQLYGHPDKALGNQVSMYTTQTSTTPTSAIGKGAKRIPSYIKGIQTNQKQLESKKKNEPSNKPGGNGSSAFNLIQQRIKDTQAQQNE